MNTDRRHQRRRIDNRRDIIRRLQDLPVDVERRDAKRRTEEIYRTLCEKYGPEHLDALVFAFLEGRVGNIRDALEQISEEN